MRLSKLEAMNRATRRARCHLDVPVRRPLGGARAPARRCSRERTARSGGSCCSAARRAPARAGSRVSSPPRRPARACWSCYGAADAVVRTPYGPFVEALEPLVRTLDATNCARRSRRRGRTGSPAARPRPARVRDAGADPDTERHRLHTAVVELLSGVTRRRAALLVLEDGHWADAATLLLLRHLARASGPRLLLLATFRDTDADVPDALAETLADLRRYDVMRMRLSALSHDEVGRFRPPRGRHRAAGLAAALHALTGGNAFLLCELWRALIETGAIELSGGAMRMHRPPERARQPGERARGRQPAPRRGWRRRPPTCSSWRRPPGRSSSSTSSAAPPGSATPSSCRRSTRPSAAG